MLRGVSSLAEVGAEGWILGDDDPDVEGFGTAGLGLSDWRASRRLARTRSALSQHMSCSMLRSSDTKRSA
jgi:hypothetical protein